MTLKPLTPVLTATLAVLALASAGCNTTSNPAYANQNKNFFNLYKYEPNSFSVRSPQSFELRSSDVVEQPNPSGDKISLLGGLFTYVDY